MKKTILLLAFLGSMSVLGQQNVKWIDNNQQAIISAEDQGKNILVLIYEDSMNNVPMLNEQLFETESFKKIQSKFIFLKVDSSSSDYNTRLAEHYTAGIKDRPVLTLVDSRGNLIGNPLHFFSEDSIRSFLKLLTDNQ